MIPYGRQSIDQSDIDSIISVLKSDYLTQGPVVPQFEGHIAQLVGAKYAVALNSATSALHTACRALGLGNGDLLWTSPITFVASANCALYCGAQVDFVDIDRRTFNMCPIALKQKLTKASEIGRLPKIIVPVHLCGQSCEMKAIQELARQYGVSVIEDASHAIGGKYQGQYIGDCRYSDITIFSFHPVKIITTAEGGMAVTNDHKLFDTMALLRSHGITRDPTLMTHSPDGPWYYQQIDLGYNYRMTDLQAALGISQLNRIQGFIERRQAIASKYDSMLSKFPINRPWQHPDSDSAFHLYVIRLCLDKIKFSHRQVFEQLRRQDIGVNLHYIPVHLQPFYTALGFRSGDYPEAEKYYNTAISLPIYPAMTDAQVEDVAKALSASI